MTKMIHVIVYASSGRLSGGVGVLLFVKIGRRSRGVRHQSSRRRDTMVNEKPREGRLGEVVTRALRRKSRNRPWQASQEIPQEQFYPNGAGKHAKASGGLVKKWTHDKRAKLIRPPEQRKKKHQRGKPTKAIWGMKNKKKYKNKCRTCGTRTVPYFPLSEGK